MTIEIIGADRDDPGPQGLVVRFLLASDAGDAETALALLTASSREGLEFNPEAVPGGTARIGEAVSEEDGFVVPTTIEEEEGAAQEMPFVVREEDGELRIDLNRSMERMMDFSPEDLLEKMGESLAEGMGQVMEGIGEALAAGFDSLGEGLSAAMAAGAEPPGEAVERRWVYDGEAFPAEAALQVALGLGERCRPPFAPPAEELDAEEWAQEGTRSRTSRHGTTEEGFQVVTSLTEMEGFASHSVSLAAYGLPEDRELSIAWVRSVVGGAEPTVNISISARAPEADLAELENWLAATWGAPATLP